jgi:hypothetical protein
VFKQQYANLPGQRSHKLLIHFILRQYLAQRDLPQDGGYAMLIVSVLSVFIFSLMAAYLTLTNMGTSSTNAYIDGANTFYAAESGLNTRANQLRQRFVGYTVPKGLSPGQVTTASIVTPANIANCFPLPISTGASSTNNDFECRNYAFKYNGNAATVKGNSGNLETIDRNQKIDYTAYTFVADRTNYDPTSAVGAPIPHVIPAGDLYAGLNSQQYLYTVYSTAAKIDPADPVGSSQRGDAKTVLQMDFKSQIIPLFQFAAFYDRDLEINSSTPMTLSGRVHTNANLYVQPTPLTSVDPDINFLSKVTVAGDIYNRIESLTVWNRDGRFVSLSSADLTVPATTTDLVAALNSSDATIAPTNPPAADAFSGNSVLFIRALPSGTTVGSFDRLGLAAADTTERGLVLHASVDDYLDGRVPDGTPDAFGDPSKKIYKLKPDGNWATDTSGNPIILDYYRLYPHNKTTGWTNNTPYAFAVNGGRNLPGAMTVASDQAIYLQGDYNTIAKKPAAIMADTITTLSVNCLSADRNQDPFDIPTANVNCVINWWNLNATRLTPWTNLTNSQVNSSIGVMYKAQTTSVNAAFLSFTSQSWGNLGVGRGYGSHYYSGGLNNYMRFLENWNGQNFNYNGSLVSLGSPLEFGGGFRAGGQKLDPPVPPSYFSPPNRNFNYDTSFNAFPSLPPMTPSVIYLQQDVFKRNH